MVGFFPHPIPGLSTERTHPSDEFSAQGTPGCAGKRTEVGTRPRPTMKLLLLGLSLVLGIGVGERGINRV